MHAPPRRACRGRSRSKIGWITEGGKPAILKPDALEAGYHWAYREFYKWASIVKSSLFHGSLKHQAKHFFYASGWKKFEPPWDWIIRARNLNRATPILEAVLSKISRDRSAKNEVKATNGATVGTTVGATAVNLPAHHEPLIQITTRRTTA